MALYRVGMLVMAALACQRPVSHGDTAETGRAIAELRADTTLHPYAADSIVLQRSPCFGECPAYRLTVTRKGLVHFESLTPGDSGRSAADSLPTGDAFATLAQHVEVSNFLALPDSIATDERFGGACVTDHPTAVVTVYFGVRSKQVVDYLGCMWGPAALRDLEVRIDQVAHSERWVRRPRFG